MTKKPATRIEDAISLPAEGPPTLEQWKRMQTTVRPAKHVVRRQPAPKSVGE